MTKHLAQFAAVAFSLSLSACVAVLPPSAFIPYDDGTEPRQITSAAASVLQQHEFVVSVVDPEVGIVVTDWRRVSDVQKENFSLAMVGERFQERMRISLVVNAQARQISIKTMKQKHTNQAGWREFNLDEGDKEMLKLFARDLAVRLGLPISSVEWTDPLESPEPAPAPELSRKYRLLTGAAFAIAAAIIFAGYLAYNST